jgi:hypothetical protein
LPLGGTATMLAQGLMHDEFKFGTAECGSLELINEDLSLCWLEPIFHA